MGSHCVDNYHITRTDVVVDDIDVDFNRQLHDVIDVDVGDDRNDSDDPLDLLVWQRRPYDTIRCSMDVDRVVHGHLDD